MDRLADLGTDIPKETNAFIHAVQHGQTGGTRCAVPCCAHSRFTAALRHLSGSKVLLRRPKGRTIPLQLGNPRRY
jgi:hypothetical protein